MPKTQVKLKFPTVQVLWQFAQRIKATNIEINTREQTLIYDCNELEVGLAVEEYHAVIIK